MPSKRGFTLIELVVTIVVLAIIATLAAPSFSEIIEQRQLDSSTESLVGLLEETHNQAVLTQRATTLALDSTVATPTYTWHSPNKTSITSTTPAHVNSITFQGGGIANNQITISLTNGAHTKNVVVSMIGNISTN